LLLPYASLSPFEQVHLPGHGHSHDHDHDHCDGGDSHNDRAHGSSASEAEHGCSGGGGHDHSHSHSHASNAAEKGHSHDHRHEHAGKTTASETDALLLSKNPALRRSYTPEHANEVIPDFEEPQKKKKRNNVNLHAAYLHVLGDLCQSVAVMVAGIVIWFKPNWMIVDPLCTLGFCILVFHSTLGVIRRSFAVLLEEVPPNISYTDVVRNLGALPNVENVHCCHIWNISDGKPCVSLHASATDEDCGKALKQIFEVCRASGISHITAQVQPKSSGDCITCDEDLEHDCY